MSILEKLIPPLRTYVDRRIADAIAQLEERLGKTTAPLRYEGTWTADSLYARGAFTTFQGSLWHCEFETRDRPGRSDAWRLAVKRGRDGLDATQAARHTPRRERDDRQGNGRLE